MKSIFLAAALAASSCLAVSATADTLARDGIKAALVEAKAETPDDHFRIGALETLAAFENMAQTRWRYNIGFASGSLPMMQLRLAYNEAGEQAGPDAIANLAEQFLEDIAPAQASLARAGEAGDAEFVLSLSELWFDVNANGARDANEDLVKMARPILQGMFRTGPNAIAAARDAEIRFDESDVHWLHAYTELLSATAHLYIAFDPADAIGTLAVFEQQLVDAPVRAWVYTAQERDALLAEIEVKREALKAELEAVRLPRARGQEANNVRRQITKLKREAKPDTVKIAELQAIVDAYNADYKAIRPVEQRIRREQLVLRSEAQAIVAKSPVQQDDRFENQREWLNIAFIVLRALEQTPDGAHIKAASDSMKGMIAANKRFWASVMQETDNDREWIPNPSQTAVLGFELPADTGPLWQSVLSDVEQVLEGDLLIPHMVLPPGYGINLAKYVEDPVGLDLVGSVQASTLGPFIERGPVVSDFAWSSFRRAMGRNAMGFALLLN